MIGDMALCEELFHTTAGTAFADILVDSHRETWPIRSKRFRGWLRRCHYEATGAAASAAEVRSTLDLLETLPANQQEVVRLKFQNGFSYQEISRISGLSVSNVGYLLHHALKNLRSRLPDGQPLNAQS